MGRPPPGDRPNMGQPQTEKASLRIGDAVEVRDNCHCRDWKAAHVTSLQPLKVKVDGWSWSTSWDEVRFKEVPQLQLQVPVSGRHVVGQEAHGNTALVVASSLNIVIRDPRMRDVQVAVGRDQPLMQLMSTARLRLEIPEKAIVYFTFHGKIVEPSDSAEEFHIGEGSVLYMKFGKPPMEMATTNTSFFKSQQPVYDLEWRCDACGAVRATGTARILMDPEMECERCGTLCCPDVWQRPVTANKETEHHTPDTATYDDYWDDECCDVNAPVGAMLAIVVQEQRERLLKGAIIYFLFCLHFLIIATMQRPVHKMFEVQNALEQELISQVVPGTPGHTFHDISSWSEFWQWTDGVLVDKVYSENYWPDESGAAARAPYSSFTVGRYNRVLSAIRFRQVRVQPALPQCPHNSMGLLPSEFEVACSREKGDEPHSCETALESHALSRPCWGSWNLDHQETVYPGPVEKASSKITQDPAEPQWNFYCKANCEAYYRDGYRTVDQLPALGLPGIALFLLNFDRYISPLDALSECSAACDISGSQFLRDLSPFSGKDGTPDFSSSGDVVDLPLNTSEALRLVAAMKRERWTSESTRAVVVELNTYNPNYDMAAVVRLVVDASPGGLLQPHAQVQPCRLNFNEDTVDVVRFILEILFACWLMYYFIIEILEMYNQTWLYFADMWNYLELANLGTYIYFLAVWWLYQTGHNFDTYRSRTVNDFKELHDVANEFNSARSVTSWCVVFMCFRFFKFFRLSFKFRMFWDTLRKAGPILLPVTLAYVAFILAFTWCGHWLFGERIEVFSSMSSAVMHMALSVKNGINYTELRGVCPIGAPIWYTAWYLLSKLGMLGIIIAITTVVFGEMLHQYQAQEKAKILAEQQGAKIPRLRDYFIRDVFPIHLLPGMDTNEHQRFAEYFCELKETLQEVDLEKLWDRGLQALLANQVTLDATDLKFLFGHGQTKTSEEAAQHFINRLSALCSLQDVPIAEKISVLHEVEDLEAKVSRIIPLINACRKGLEKRFSKLRPYIAKARERALELQENKTGLSRTNALNMEADRQVRYVFKEKMYIGETEYLVEMSTKGLELSIQAHDASRERTLDLNVYDEDFQRLLGEAAWDYKNIAQRLRHGIRFGPNGEQTRLELGPPQEHIVPVSRPPKLASHVRIGNSVFPGGDDGAKPPQKGQLKVASAVLDTQAKGSPLMVSIVDISARPEIKKFLKAQPLKRSD